MMVNSTITDTFKLRRRAFTLLGLGLCVLLGLSPVPSQAQGPQSAPAETTEGDIAPAESAEQSTPLPVPPPYRSREERDMKLLARAIPDPESILWLKTGSEEFLTLYEADFSGKPQGAVLLLHAEGQHPSWPQTMEAIRTHLPAFGWSTLAMALPLPENPALPERDPEPVRETPTTETSTETTDTTPDTESPPLTDNTTGSNETGSVAPQAMDPAAPAIPENGTGASTLTTRQRALERIGAAMAFLHEQGLFNLAVIGDGMGATRGGQFFRTLNYDVEAAAEDNTLKPLQALVIINARNEFPEGEFYLPESLHDPELAILDIYFGIDPRDRHEAQRRKRYAQRNNFSVYQQIRFPELPAALNRQDNRLSRRVRGFLNRHARGRKVDNAIVQ